MNRDVDYKKRWREKQANREAEAQAHRARRTEKERLAESMRDTIRHIDKRGAR